MRVIGRISFSALAERAAPRLREAVLALNAELEAAEWRSAEEAAAAFPTARRNGIRLVIVLDALHCAVVVISRQSKIAVIEYAGSNADWIALTETAWSKSA